MKKIAKAFVSIICLVLLTVFTTGCADKIDKKTLRQEQERLAEYTIQKFEGVKKIEFTSFEQNFSTRSWTTHITINDNIYVKYRVDDIGKNRDIGIAYYIEESGGKRIERKKDKKKSNGNVEIKYWKG